MIKSEREYAVTKRAAAGFASSREALTGAAGEDAGRRAALSSIDAQLGDLQADIAEWERLRAGGVQDIDVANWDDLPKALIRARIAQGLTQQELAERLGLRKQQIQRWEDEDYEHAAFWRVLEVADALGLSLTGKAMLAQPTRPNLEAIKGCVKRAGMDVDFVDRWLVPRRAADDPAAAAETVGVRLKAIWGLGIEDMLAANANATPAWKAVANARFKRPANADPKAVTAQEGFSAWLLMALCDATGRPRQPGLPADPAGMRRLLFGNQPPSFGKALDSVWKLGIPVLPLSDRGGFHAACFRFAGRSAIALKQSQPSQARWLFDLAHELGHLAEDDDPSLRIIEPEGPSDGQDTEAEARAHDFAAKVLLGSEADHIFPEAWRRASGQPARLKRVTAALAGELRLDVGLVAQHVAFRARREHGVNWWGTARNLEATAAAPFDIARDALLRHVSLDRVQEPARGMLLQVLERDG
ncbi:MAG: helix-turn-helix domain-containing protein [Acetobacteraceae bacterium]|nr:helix-turn-helix domain-containing protein [Acetobacteraceae bacterium]